MYKMIVDGTHNAIGVINFDVEFPQGVPLSALPFRHVDGALTCL